MTSQALPPALPAALLQADNLPSLPAVAVEVLRLTQDDGGTIDELAGALSADPALSAKLLKLSNSSLFNLGQEVSTLQRATMVLGMKTVKLMSLSFSLATSLPRSGNGAFDFERYWRRSLVSAVAGRSLARLVGSRSGDEAFLCGLLSHLGQLVLSQCLEETYAPVLEHAGDRWPTIALEQKLLGFSSADVADALLAEWNLPSSIRRPIAYMNRPHVLPKDTSDEQRELTYLMAVVGLVVNVLCEEDCGPSTKKLYELMEKRFGVAQRELEAWLIGLESGIRETAEMLNVKIPSDLDHGRLVDQARLQIVDISLGTSIDLRQAERRAADLRLQNQELLSRATRDKLTGLPNRDAFDDTLSAEIGQRAKPGLPRCLGLVMIDVDRFKRFNDEHGHQAGDAVLSAVGEVLAQQTRKGDLAARYGGEEFALILPATTPGHMRAICERIRRAIESRTILYEGSELSITASFGGACLQRTYGADAGAALVRAADTCLYEAKQSGRNRSVVRSELLDDEGPAEGSVG